MHSASPGVGATVSDWKKWKTGLPNISFKWGVDTLLHNPNTCHWYHVFSTFLGQIKIKFMFRSLTLRGGGVM